MSLPTTLKFSKMLIMLGDGNSPEFFTAPCGLTARVFNLTDNTSEFQIVGEEWPVRTGALLSCKISGAGILAADSFDAWNDWFLSRMTQNVQVQLDGLGIYQGSFLLSAFGMNGSYGERVKIELSMESSGEVEWVSE